MKVNVLERKVQSLEDEQLIIKNNVVTNSKEREDNEKCEFTTKSDGMIRRHKVIKHGNHETEQNIMLGFESDMQQYRNILEIMRKDLRQFICEKCDFVSHSKGKLTLHKLTTHQG